MDRFIFLVFLPLLASVTPLKEVREIWCGEVEGRLSVGE